MSISVEKLHDNFGGKLFGVNLSSPESLSFDEIRQALFDYQVLVIPGQSLTRETFFRFAKLFGPPEVFVLPGFIIPPDPDDAALVQRLTNLSTDGEPMGPCTETARMSITENWHSDSSYRLVPSFTTLLFGVEIPEVGGDTQFASMYAAYEALPAALRQTIEHRSAVHSWEHQRKLIPQIGPMGAKEAQDSPPVLHPLVQCHPQSGRKLLYTSASAEWIQGLPLDESRHILDELMAISTRSEAVYIHKWHAGDLVMWDNRAVLHRAGQFDYQSRTLRRLLLRQVIAGSPDEYAGHHTLDESN